MISTENTLIDLPELNRFRIGDRVIAEACYDHDRFEGVVIGIELQRVHGTRRLVLKPSITLLHDVDQITDGFQPGNLRKVETPPPQTHVVGSDVADDLRKFFAQSLDWADENGWTDDACQKDRIVDWFGPSDFFEMRQLIERLEATPATDVSTPALWAECAYCKEAGEEECLHPVDELRWNGEQWCCEECGSGEEPDLWQSSPRIAIPSPQPRAMGTPVDSSPVDNGESGD